MRWKRAERPVSKVRRPYEPCGRRHRKPGGAEAGGEARGPGAGPAHLASAFARQQLKRPAPARACSVPPSCLHTADWGTAGGALQPPGGVTRHGRLRLPARSLAADARPASRTGSTTASAGTCRAWGAPSSTSRRGLAAGAGAPAQPCCALTARRTRSCATSCGRPPRTTFTWCTEPASSTGTTWRAGRPRRAHARAAGCACCAAHAGRAAARLTPALHVRAAAQVLDLSGAPQDAGHAGRVRVTTSCVRGNLVAAGGMNGELAVANLENGPGPAFRWRCGWRRALRCPAVRRQAVQPWCPAAGLTRAPCGPAARASRSRRTASPTASRSLRRRLARRAS